MAGGGQHTESGRKMASAGKSRPILWLIIFGGMAYAVYHFDLPQKFGFMPASAPDMVLLEPHREASTYTRLAAGVAIVDRFRSYQDVSTVLESLEKAGYEDVQRSTRRAVESEEYPPFRFDKLTVEKYAHLKHPGVLTLQFFNDRLFQAEFVPSDPEEYARKQRQLGLERDQNARREKIEGDLRVASTVELAISTVGQNLGTEPFVIWQDLSLIRQREQWDRHFGAIPKQMVADY